MASEALATTMDELERNNVKGDLVSDRNMKRCHLLFTFGTAKRSNSSLGNRQSLPALYFGYSTFVNDMRMTFSLLRPFKSLCKVFGQRFNEI